MRKGLISSTSVLVSVISKYPFKITKCNSLMGALSLLGVLSSMNLIPPRKVIECMVNPRDEDFDLEEAELSVPLQTVLKAVLEIAGKEKVEDVNLNFLSDPEPREEYVDEYEPQFVAVILQVALMKAKALEENWDSFISGAVEKLIVIPKGKTIDSLFFAQLIG